MQPSWCSGALEPVRGVSAKISALQKKCCQGVALPPGCEELPPALAGGVAGGGEPVQLGGFFAFPDAAPEWLPLLAEPMAEEEEEEAPLLSLHEVEDVFDLVLTVLQPPPTIMQGGGQWQPDGRWVGGDRLSS